MKAISNILPKHTPAYRTEVGKKNRNAEHGKKQQIYAEKENRKRHVEKSERI